MARNHILQVVKNLSENGTTILYTTYYMEEVQAIASKAHYLTASRWYIIVGQAKKKS
ncbi:MAG: hypothetical protein ACE3L7_19805 [Candidatus Pristimantibacillus sp.]